MMLQTPTKMAQRMTTLPDIRVIGPNNALRPYKPSKITKHHACSKAADHQTEMVQDLFGEEVNKVKPKSDLDEYIEDSQNHPPQTHGPERKPLVDIAARRRAQEAIKRERQIVARRDRLVIKQRHLARAAKDAITPALKRELDAASMRTTIESPEAFFKRQKAEKKAAPRRRVPLANLTLAQRVFRRS